MGRRRGGNASRNGSSNYSPFNYDRRIHGKRNPPYNANHYQTVKKVQPPSEWFAPSFFLRLKHSHDFEVPVFPTITIEDVCKNLILRDEAILILTLSQLNGIAATDPQLFKDKFDDGIMSLIGELFSWEEDVSEDYIFILNKVFQTIYELPVMTVLGLFDKLCGYVLKGLKNKQYKMKILSLHILRTHIFPRCPATMNKELFYQYLDFLSENCDIKMVNIDVLRAGLITLPCFLNIYLRDNDPNYDEYIEIKIHDGQLSIDRDPEIDNDYTFGGTVFYDIHQWYPTNTKNGIAVLGLCSFKFLAKIFEIDNFPLENHYNYIADILALFNQIVKRYVTDHCLPSARYGKAFVSLMNKLGFMVTAAHNKMLSGFLMELMNI